MINELKFLSNGLSRMGELHQQVDVNKLENVISWESVIIVCFQFITPMIHNQAFRRECRLFEHRAAHHQGELRKIFQLSEESEAKIENNVYKYLLWLDPPGRSLRSVLNISISLSASKSDAYKFLSHVVQDHHELLDGFVQDSVEEMKFLYSKKKKYIHETWATDMGISL